MKQSFRETLLARFEQNSPGVFSRSGPRAVCFASRVSPVERKNRRLLVDGALESATELTRREGPGSRAFIDVGVAASLALVLCAIYVLDAATSASAPPAISSTEVVATASELPEPPPPVPLPKRPPVDPTPRVQVHTTPDGRFGLTCLTGNPDDATDDGKRLTFSPEGQSNNTRLMIDGQTPLFGDLQGQTVEPWHAGPGGSTVMDWSYRDIAVRQSVRLVAGDVSNRTDTIRVTYELRNTGQARRKVGLRVMLDTLIGDNDGVPFIVPGREGIVTNTLAMTGSAVPDFVRSLERPDLSSPGVIVDINLVPAEGELRPSELLLSHWPGENAEWNYPRDTSFGDDTAAAIYYAPSALEPGSTRAIGFSYGLGTISSTTTRNARLSLTAGGPIRAGSSFWLVALVNQPRSGQTVNLVLPDGLTPRRPASLSQPVLGSGPYAQSSWLIEVAPSLLGEVQVAVMLDPGNITEKQTLSVLPPDVQLSLVPRGPFQSGRPFWISALVRSPRSGQSVTLALPDGWKFAKDHNATLPVGSADPAGYAQINWLVIAGSDGRREIHAQLAPDGVKGDTTIEVKAGDLTH
jgi:hypothetical protein